MPVAVKCELCIVFAALSFGSTGPPSGYGSPRVRVWVSVFTRIIFRVRVGFLIRVSGAGPRTIHPTRTCPVASPTPPFLSRSPVGTVSGHAGPLVGGGGAPLLGDDVCAWILARRRVQQHGFSRWVDDVLVRVLVACWPRIRWQIWWCRHCSRPTSST